LIEVRPHYFQGRIQLAQLLSEQGDHDSALAIYEELMARNPNSFNNIRWQIRRLYQSAGRGEDLAKLDDEMAARANNPDQLRQLGYDYQNQGDYEKAAEMFEKASRWTPRSITPTQVLPRSTRRWAASTTH
jgi:tetratricopeptide (TPR) repeat protein